MCPVTTSCTFQHEFERFLPGGWLLRSASGLAGCSGRFAPKVPVVVPFHTEPLVNVPDGKTVTEGLIYRSLWWRWHVRPHFRRQSTRLRAIVHTRKSRLAGIIVYAFRGDRCGIGHESVIRDDAGEPR